MKEFNLINKKNQKINIIEGENEFFNNKLIPKGIIIHIHGMGSHFQPVFDSVDEFSSRDKLFSKIDLKSFALEFHGHGKSEGIRCCIYSFEDLLDDLDTLINYIETNYNLPIFLFAESMGCAVALKYCITKKNNIKGLLFMAPLFGIDDSLKPNFIIATILKFVSYFFPTLPLVSTSKNMNSASTDNQNFIEARKSCDFSYTGSHRLCTAKEMLLVSEWINENGHLIDVPIIIFHGLKDVITQPSITKNIFNNMVSTNKELYLFEDGYHCLLLEGNENPYLPGYIIGKMMHWLNKLLY